MNNNHNPLLEAFDLGVKKFIDKKPLHITDYNDAWQGFLARGYYAAQRFKDNQKAARERSKLTFQRITYNEN